MLDSPLDSSLCWALVLFRWGYELDLRNRYPHVLLVRVFRLPFLWQVCQSPTQLQLSEKLNEQILHIIYVNPATCLHVSLQCRDRKSPWPVYVRVWRSITITHSSRFFFHMQFLGVELWLGVDPTLFWKGRKFGLPPAIFRFIWRTTMLASQVCTPTFFFSFSWHFAHWFHSVCFSATLCDTSGCDMLAAHRRRWYQPFFDPSPDGCRRHDGVQHIPTIHFLQCTSGPPREPSTKSVAWSQLNYRGTYVCKTCPGGECAIRYIVVVPVAHTMPHDMNSPLSGRSSSCLRA